MGAWASLTRAVSEQLGFRRRSAPAPGARAGINPAFITSFPAARGGWARIWEPFAGAWQKNVELAPADVLAYSAVYACVTLIASDVSKLRILLTAETSPGIWEPITNPAYTPVLRKPNRYQTRIAFLEHWITSKLIAGNTYVLKERDVRGVVRALYVLDPSRVRPLVAPDGSVLYELAPDNLAAVPESIKVPASEIIHDRNTPLYHPLVGVSPITACGLAAVQGLRVQVQSASFFGNGSVPGGILTSPIPIDDEEAEKMGRAWQEKFSGDNAGKVAVLGGDLKYQPLVMSAVDAQLIEQLRWTAENVCTAFHVPAFMAGVAPAPAYNNVEALNQQYYSQCLQNPIESIEALLDEGLGLDPSLRTELDLDGLLRMDTAAVVKAAAESIGGGGMSPNEARARWFNLPAVKGGESPYLQQQNFSLAALSKRDAQADPFGTAPKPAPAPAAPDAPADVSAEKAAAAVLRLRAYAAGLTAEA